MLKQTKKALRKGFTLIELLVIVVVMGILAAGVFRLVNTGDNEAAEAKTQRKLQAIANLLETYHAVMGEYPPVTSDSVAFEIVITLDSCSCGLAKNPITTFGLCSHFLPRATFICDNAASRLTDFNNSINSKESETTGEKSLQDQEDEVWRKEFSSYQGIDKAIQTCAEGETANMGLQRVHLAWRQLLKEKIVHEGYYSCPDYRCKTVKFVASFGDDGWGNGLRYVTKGGRHEVVSNGPDGIANTSDDLSSTGASNSSDPNDESIYGD